ncbi:MAG: hypothetical protein M3P53_02220, partial [Actinomycetota bacterium]|nr:hypothetical protein [Actinomycetota bacterium]
MNPTLTELAREWAELDRSPTATAALERWRKEEPAVAGLSSLSAVLRERRAHPAKAPAILAALARLASGDALAARALLHAMVPGLLKLASTTFADDPLAFDEFVSLAWERIRTYPTSRPGSVAANVIWDVRKRYCEHRSIEEPESLPSSTCLSKMVISSGPEVRWWRWSRHVDPTTAERSLPVSTCVPATADAIPANTTVTLSRAPRSPCGIVLGRREARTTAVDNGHGCLSPPATHMVDAGWWWSATGTGFQPCWTSQNRFSALSISDFASSGIVTATISSRRSRSSRRARTTAWRYQTSPSSRATAGE